MDMVVAGLDKLPFWPQVVALGATQGLSPELVSAVVIGVITTLISILMLPKTPPPLVALVSEALFEFQCIYSSITNLIVSSPLIC